MAENIEYIGTELELFQHATNWKYYYSSYIKPYLKNTVLEIGAGIAGTTSFMFNDNVEKWYCVEPDQNLGSIIADKISKKQLPLNCEYVGGVIDDVPVVSSNAVIYIDVIEHIENDKLELQKAAAKLVSGGYLCIIVPANPLLYNEFDKAIGHYRRYNKKMLKDALPDGFTIKELKYLDSLGMITSWVNKLFLHQSRPTLTQIKFWDQTLVPVSKILDKIVCYSFGKSLLLIAQKS
jgi:hypothetical protein